MCGTSDTFRNFSGQQYHINQGCPGQKKLAPEVLTLYQGQGTEHAASFQRIAAANTRIAD
jgi:hypothetical protein